MDHTSSHWDNRSLLAQCSLAMAATSLEDLSLLNQGLHAQQQEANCEPLQTHAMSCPRHSNKKSGPSDFSQFSKHLARACWADYLVVALVLASQHQIQPYPVSLDCRENEAISAPPCDSADKAQADVFRPINTPCKRVPGEICFTSS